MRENVVAAVDVRKKQCESVYRNLWRGCFGDPVPYENFYFDKVYPHNRVYGIQDKGMLHLNPYLCSVAGRRKTLHYIVGVATGEAYRRQGIMRELMHQALMDMYAAKEPFTYLMPADERYYIPFDFCRVSRKVEYKIETIPQLALQSDTGKKFVSYQEIKQKAEQERQSLFQTINQWLDNRYAVYAVHDEAYFDLLFEEKRCQNGDVIFCFEETCNSDSLEDACNSDSFGNVRNSDSLENACNADSLCGMFAYVMDGNRPCVEQIVKAGCKKIGRNIQQIITEKNIEEHVEENREKYLTQYFIKHLVKCPDISVISSYPYMVRIVHMESFLNLFADYILESLNGADGIAVTDDILRDNNGRYRFVKENNGISVFRCKAVSGGDYIPMTVSQIADIVFGEKDNVFFAEIV